MINNALKAIIDLLKLRKDVKKTDLEINKLEREQKKAESIIQHASFEDIERYDPKTREIINSVRESADQELRAQLPMYRVVPWIVLILLLIGGLYMLYRLFT